MTSLDEDTRAEELLHAEDRAAELFAEITRRGLVAPGAWESEVSRAVRDLGADMFGTSRYWHKRVVRSGGNTLQPYQENPRRGWTRSRPGPFPHDHIDPDRHRYLTTGNDIARHDASDEAGRRFHWILEVHLVDAERRVGGFTEQLLSLRRPA